MFQGETAITLDDKGRIAIPAMYRELVAKVCANRLVAAYNPFELGCLWIYPQGEWEQVRDRVNTLSSMKATHRNMQMKLVGAAAHLELDSNGRILLPARQREVTGLEKRAVLLGMGNKFELWNEQIQLAKVRETITEDQITEEMAELTL